MSRPTVREAIRRLEAEGVLEVRRGVAGGTFVSRPDAARVGRQLTALIRLSEATADDFAEFRASLEPENAWWAATRATPSERARLVEMARGIGTRSDHTWESFAAADIQFHQAVAEASHNPLRVAVMLAVQEAFLESSATVGASDSPEWRAAQAEQLAAVAAAIRARRPDGARQAMAKHVDANRRAVEAARESGRGRQRAPNRRGV